MFTTIGGKAVVSTKTGHTVITPPAVSNIPPMTPPKPDGVPAPFPYFGRSRTATGCSTKMKVKSGGKVLLKGKSTFDVDAPGNMPSKPAPLHDLVTQQVKAKFSV